MGKLEQLRRNLDSAFAVQPSGRDADEWEQVADDYARQLHLLPPARLLPSLTPDFSDLNARITEAAGDVRTRLVHSASQLAALTAIGLTNLREQAASVRWWRTASRAAEATGDRQLAASITGRRAIMSMYTDTPDHVLAMAERAIAAGGSSPCAGVISGL